jgi:hypothetical protein
VLFFSEYSSASWMLSPPFSERWKLERKVNRDRNFEDVIFSHGSGYICVIP